VSVLGLRTYRNRVCWATADGKDRATATITNHADLQIPATTSRGAALSWVRQELTAVVHQEHPASAVLCPAEGQTANKALTERAEVDGVVLEVLHTLGIPTKVKKSATIKSSFGARKKEQFETTVQALPVLAGIPRTAARREPAVAAVSELPK
jgi:hypothetical protein